MPKSKPNTAASARRITSAVVAPAPRQKKPQTKKVDPVSRYQQLSREWSSINLAKSNLMSREGRKLQMASRIATSKPDALYNNRYLKRSELFN